MFINETYFLSIQLVTPKNSKFTCSEYNFKWEKDRKTIFQDFMKHYSQLHSCFLNSGQQRTWSSSWGHGVPWDLLPPQTKSCTNRWNTNT
jgi:hypothetical protein